MSKMMLRSKCKPPLARSPVRPRARREPLQSMSTNTIRSPPGSMMKSKKPDPFWNVEKPELRPEYQTISYEIRALSKIVNHKEYGLRDCTTLEGGPFGAQRGPLFERGRFYDEYAARRNERLKRKKSEIEGEGLYTKKPGYDLGVRVESAKKRESNRRKSGTMAMVAAAAIPVAERRLSLAAAATPVAERLPSVPTVATQRYSLRSSTRKDNTKPPMPSMNVENSVGLNDRKVGVRRTRKA